MSRESSGPPTRHCRRCSAIMVHWDEDGNDDKDRCASSTARIKLTKVSLIHLHSSLLSSRRQKDLSSPLMLSESLGGDEESSTTTNRHTDNEWGRHHYPCWLVHHASVDDSIIEIQTIPNRRKRNIDNDDNDNMRCPNFSTMNSLFPTATYYAIHDNPNDDPDADNNVKNSNVVAAECREFLHTTLNSWYSNRFQHSLRGKFHNDVISSTDVHRLCHSFTQWKTRMRHHDRRRHSLRRQNFLCPCNNMNCIANAIVSELGIDAGELNTVHSLEMIRKHRQQSLMSPSLYRSRWRLVLVDRISNPIIHNINETTSSIHDEQLQEPFHRKNDLSACLLLPQHDKRPLIAISLCAIQSTTTASSSNSIITDALLRACVKRLLVGKIVLHSDFPMKSNIDTTLSIRTKLFVRLPNTNPLSTLQHKDEHNQLLEFRVVSVQIISRNYDGCNDEGSNAELPTQLVILPSTKISFQLSETEAEQQQPHTQVATEGVSQNNLMPEMHASASHAAHTSISVMLSSPHQHLVESLRSIIFFQPMNNADHEYARLPFPRSFLFTGPPGVGKTYSVKKALTIANSWSLDLMRSNQVTGEYDPVRLISLRGSEILASSGGSYAIAALELRRQFDMARSACNAGVSPHIAGVKAVIIFLDECDALVSLPVVAAMLAVLLDKMEGDIDATHGKSGWDRVIVVAATNRVDAIPNFLRRPGRLEKEVVVSPPTAEERCVLLKSMLGSSDNTSFVSIDEVGLQKVAEACVGYVAADISALVRKAAMISIENIFHNQHGLTQLSLIDHPMITTNDLFVAMNDVGASCLRDSSLSAPPKTTWDDIAGDAGGAKRALREALEWPRIYKTAFKAQGLSPPRGVLLHGPPGCAKTTLARAAAGAAGVAFLSLSPADVYASSYVGEAEAIVRRAFDLARSAAPCVLFFDEIDSIIGGDNTEGSGKHGNMSRGSSAEARVLSTFLNEMDGVDGSIEDGVLVLGATNRPSMLDAALLRPGRFDRVIYVPPPDEEGRKAIFLMECKKWHTSLSDFFNPKDATESSTYDSIPSYEKSFNIEMLASEDISGSMTGAEIVGACREASVQVMQTILETGTDLHNDISSDMVERHMQSLLSTLKATLAIKTPLLSKASVLDEYTKFELNRKER